MGRAGVGVASRRMPQDGAHAAGMYKGRRHRAAGSARLPGCRWRGKRGCFVWRPEPDKQARAPQELKPRYAFGLTRTFPLACAAWPRCGALVCERDRSVFLDEFWFHSGPGSPDAGKVRPSALLSFCLLGAQGERAFRHSTGCKIAIDNAQKRESLSSSCG